MPRPDGALPYPVARMPSLPMPGYPGFRIAAAGSGLRAALTGHGTELVHLASPFMLGGGGAFVASRLRLPMVAVYQTDMPSYARAYRFGPAGQVAAWRRVRRIHNAADRTLAPSTAAAASLHAHGIQQVWLWGRGVDTVRFDPAKRSEQLRAELAPNGEVLAGYVGRLAPEKRTELLAQVAMLPGVRLVIVGSGPAEAAARRAMPAAVFLGQRQGEELARIYASLDVFVHSGPHETFGQTLQEAAASGLPVVAPAAGGPIDLVGNGVTGFLVPPYDPGALADAVARLAADPRLRASQGRAARQRVLGRTWTALGDELIGHYEAVLRAGSAVEVSA
jgi:phosphatidylinositol alpha 1,6-mannosyltransferase